MFTTNLTVLQNGYCHSVLELIDQSFVADCSVCLITGNFSPILVDTSGPWNRDKLVADIKDAGFECGDIRTVVCTHGHSDHIGNLNLFPSAKFIVGFDIFQKNQYESFDFKAPDACYKLNEDVYVIPTPGHTNADVSIVVNNTDLGTIVLAGDIFENESDFSQPSQWQSLSENVNLQTKSRNKIIKLADYIVPGHGKMFAVSQPMKLSAATT